MLKPISEETRKKIIEAHELGLSIRTAAEYAGASNRTVLRYWRAAGLKPHFKRGQQCVSKETQDLIYTAWKLGLSSRTAAEYAGASNRTVLRYWRAAGLKPHFKIALSEETQDLIYTAWKLRLSAGKAAEYAGASNRTVLRYWRAAGLEPHTHIRAGAPVKARLTNLLDDVFDTTENPNEQLELEQIVQRLKDRLGKERINVSDLKEKINRLVGWGYYAVVQEGGKTYYRAGMPSAMDGMVKKELIAR